MTTNFLLYVIIGIFGFGVGVVIGRLSKRVDGLFIVDDSDYKTTRWTIDVKDPDNIPKKKEVRLRVVKMAEEVV